MAKPNRAQLTRELLLEILPPTAHPLIADLEFMAEYKYDSYEMYGPGTRFLEQLFVWLKQFEYDDRVTAVRFVRERLIFISQREMQDLARFLYYNQIVPEILEYVIRSEQLGPYDYGIAFKRHFKSYLRSCIFIGLSDSAKIDFFRRHHIDLSQEQVIPYYRSSSLSYLERLRDEMDDPDARFRLVFLIDDFMASGYTLARKVPGRHGDIEGALSRVYEQHAGVIDTADVIYVCHYVSTEVARRRVVEYGNLASAYRGKLKCLVGLSLSPGLSIGTERAPEGSLDELSAAMMGICERYHREDFEDENSKKGGGIKFGFGQIGLPLVMYSNTPNNSIFPIWLDKKDPTGKQMFSPLFMRINRHRQR